MSFCSVFPGQRVLEGLEGLTGFVNFEVGQAQQVAGLGIEEFPETLAQHLVRGITGDPAETSIYEQIATLLCQIDLETSVFDAVEDGSRSFLADAQRSFQLLAGADVMDEDR